MSTAQTCTLRLYHTTFGRQKSITSLNVFQGAGNPGNRGPKALSETSRRTPPARTADLPRTRHGRLPPPGGRRADIGPREVRRGGAASDQKHAEERLPPTRWNSTPSSTTGGNEDADTPSRAGSGRVHSTQQTLPLPQSVVGRLVRFYCKHSTHRITKEAGEVITSLYSEPFPTFRQSAGRPAPKYMSFFNSTETSRRGAPLRVKTTGEVHTHTHMSRQQRYTINWT